MIKLTIPGYPIPKARPRFAKNGRVFDKQKKETGLVRCIMRSRMAKERILNRLKGNVSVKMTFYTPTPTTWSKKRRESKFGKPDPTRPDIDNFLKFYLDAMNEIVYDDDNLVTEVYAAKKYSDKPRVEILVEELKE